MKIQHPIRERLGTGTGTCSGPGPGHLWSRYLVPVPVLVITGPDDWSRSSFNFGPGTGPSANPGPVAWLLKYSKLHPFDYILL